MTNEVKEMTEMGPRRKMQDVLAACMHRSFTVEADMYLEMGMLSQEERIGLSNAVGKALDAFNTALPESLKDRYLDPPYREMEDDDEEMMAEPSMLQRVYKAIKGVFDKEFDDSPWDGSASQWDTAAAYCSDCLIDLNEPGSEKTKDKCKLPYRKAGSSSPNKGAIRAMVSGARGLSAVNAPREAKAKAANWIIRHYQSAFGKPAPPSIYRIAGKEPPAESKAYDNRLTVFKDSSGQWWMVGIYSNRYEDREGDILSESSHLEYAEWFQKSGIKPVVTLLHYPKMPQMFWEKAWAKYQDDIPTFNQIVSIVYRDFGIAEAVRITNLNGFTIVVSKVFPGKEQIAQNLAEMADELGMSHGFFATEKADKVIQMYRTFEFTILPRERAANVFTQPLMLEGKNMPVSNEDRKFFRQAGFPDELLDNLDSATAEMSKQLEPILAYKELLTEGESSMENVQDNTQQNKPQEEVIPETPVSESTGADTPAEGTRSYEELRDQLTKDFNLQGLNDILVAIKKQMDEQGAKLDALQKQVKETDQVVKSVQMDEDQKIAAQFAPVNWGLVGFSAAKENSTAAPDPETLKKDAPGQSAPDDNPLQQMLWGELLKIAPSNPK